MRAGGIAAAVLAALAACSPAAGQSLSIRIPRVSRPPTLDDFLRGAPREAETVLTQFVQREPGDGDPVTQPTTAYLSYDEDRLYLVFVCRDDPAQIRARLNRREAILDDDHVGVLLDTFHDRQRAYLFVSNPYGVQLDGVITEGQGDDFSFDTVWASEGRLLADGYIVWMAIPFRSLRFAASPTQTWGIALTRRIARNNEQVFVPLVTRRIGSTVPQLATLEGLAGISPGRNLQLNPYAALAAARLRDVPGDTTTLHERRAGLDAKLVARDAMTVDVAINPDFSQVESDEPQVTINQRFEVFFPEKRPFFIENAGFFDTPERLFFSRRIADPDIGVRATGKLGRWAVGGLATAEDLPPDDAAGRRAGVGVVRVRRELGRESTVGALVSTRDAPSESNTVWAVDARWKLSPTWSLTGQATRSSSRERDGRLTRHGAAHWAELRRSARPGNVVLMYVHRDPSFDAPLGFIQRTDLHQVVSVIGRRWYPNRGRLQNFGPGVFGLANWDHRGRLQDWVVHPSIGFIFNGRTSLGFLHREAYERFQARDYRPHITTAAFGTGWVRWLEMSTEYNRGRQINYFPAPALAPFLGRSESARAQVVVRPSGRLLLEHTYLYDRFDTLPGMAPPATNARVYRLHILRSKLNYQLTRELSVRAILDYNGVSPNASLVDLRRRRRWSGDFLFTYLLHPGTAVFVGFNHWQERLGRSEVASREAGLDARRSTARQFFVKTSYLVRF